MWTPLGKPLASEEVRLRLEAVLLALNTMLLLPHAHPSLASSCSSTAAQHATLAGSPGVRPPFPGLVSMVPGGRRAPPSWLLCLPAQLQGPWVHLSSLQGTSCFLDATEAVEVSEAYRKPAVSGPEHPRNPEGFQNVTQLLQRPNSEKETGHAEMRSFSAAFLFLRARDGPK